MSDAPDGGLDSGTEGFAPPDGGPDSQHVDDVGAYGPPHGGGFGGYGPPPPRHLAVRPPVPGYGPQTHPAGYSGYYGPPMLREQTSGMAVAGMVLGIASLVLFWASLLGPLLAIMGIVFSSIGMSQSSKPGWTGMGMAVAGLVCSLISVAIWVALVILIASLLA